MENNVQELIGTQLGTCQLQRVLGVGGMGVVYLARQSLPVRDIAVKVLRSKTALHSEQHAEFLLRFRREANVIAQLDQINILPIYEYGEQNGLAYLVMPYLSGGSVKDLLERKKILEPEDALKLLDEAAAGLQYAHEHKIVHRDIKPANMLFHADGRLVLADFGIARIIHDPGMASSSTLTGADQFIGSVEYMAPEMIQGKHIDARADIYELGVVLFQMLTGQLPFYAQTSLMVAAQHIDTELPSLVKINPRLTYPIDAVVRRAMAKTADERYASVRDFAQAFRTAVMLKMDPGPSISQNLPFSAYQTIQMYVPANLPSSDLSYGNQIVPDPVYASSQPLVNTRQGDYLQPLHTQPLAERTKRNKAPVWLFGLLVICLLTGIGIWMQWPGIQAYIASQGQTGGSLTAPSATAVPPAISPTPSGTQQAQDVVQHFYDNVNKKDYQSAYQLWGDDYHTKYSYKSFAEGYTRTTHDDITFGDAIMGANGQIVVNVTIQATEQKLNAGTVITIYRGTYTVGSEHGSLKMLDALINVVS